jgi:hypothetical protein
MVAMFSSRFCFTNDGQCEGQWFKPERIGVDPSGMRAERFDPQLDMTRVQRVDNGRRSCGRLTQEGVVCDRGPVHDLSATGMRFVCRKLPPAEFETRIQGLGEAVVVKAKSVWEKRIGLFRHEVGVEFFELTPETSATLTRLAMVCRPRRAI